MRLKTRVKLLEDGELQDLINMNGMSDKIKELDKQFAEILDVARIGIESLHQVNIALLNYLGLEFNEDGELYKKQKKYVSKQKNKRASRRS